MRRIKPVQSARRLCGRGRAEPSPPYQRGGRSDQRRPPHPQHREGRRRQPGGVGPNEPRDLQPYWGVVTCACVCGAALGSGRRAAVGCSSDPHGLRRPLGRHPRPRSRRSSGGFGTLGNVCEGATIRADASGRDGPAPVGNAADRAVFGLKPRPSRPGNPPVLAHCATGSFRARLVGDSVTPSLSQRLLVMYSAGGHREAVGRSAQ